MVILRFEFESAAMDQNFQSEAIVEVVSCTLVCFCREYENEKEGNMKQCFIRG